MEEREEEAAASKLPKWEMPNTPASYGVFAGEGSAMGNDSKVLVLGMYSTRGKLTQYVELPATHIPKVTSHSFRAFEDE